MSKFTTSDTKGREFMLEGEGINVTVNEWSNMEGATISVTGDGAGLPLRMFGVFRWEEVDLIIAALAGART